MKKTTTSLSAASLSTSSEVYTSEVEGYVFFLNQETISELVLPPLYSTGDPLMKNFKVGYPVTSNLLPNSFSTVASTLPNGILPLRVLAAPAYSGTNFLQCPHHGA